MVGLERVEFLLKKIYSNQNSRELQNIENLNKFGLNVMISHLEISQVSCGEPLYSIKVLTKSGIITID